MASLQFVKLNLDMIALNIQSLENTSDRNEALDMLTHVAQALDKSNQICICISISAIQLITQEIN